MVLSRMEYDSTQERELQRGQIKQKQAAELLKKTGYSIVQASGKRHYGPPPDWEGLAPLRGCEVFVGKIPRDCFEDELKPIFEKVGKIYELRLMLDHCSGLNRGYCFVVFSCQAEAKKCVKQLNNYEIRKGKPLGICMSRDKSHLFVGGIPKKETKEGVLVRMRKVTEGVVDVIIYPTTNDKTRNRRYAFVDYDSHGAAATARRKLMMNSGIDLWGNSLKVDWAVPEIEVNEEIIAQVKVLYMRNLMLCTTEKQILEMFSAFGKVKRVKKIKDYAFVHFQKRDNAHKAMNAINGSMLDGAQVEVTLAKPVRKNTAPRMARSHALPAFNIPVDQYGTALSHYPGHFSPPRYDNMGDSVPPPLNVRKVDSATLRHAMYSLGHCTAFHPAPRHSYYNQSVDMAKNFSPHPTHTIQYPAEVSPLVLAYMTLPSTHYGVYST